MWLTKQSSYPGLQSRDIWKKFVDICREKEITGVFSLIDPELTMLAEHREEFLAVGTTPIISPAEAVAISFDKYRMFES